MTLLDKYRQGLDEGDLKEACLEDVRMSWSGCERCGLCEERNTIVFGTGPATARIVLIGEAPGETEDEKGDAFVGEAGGMLDDLLDGAGLDRDEMFLTNTVACRPPGNRDPFKPERDTCWPRLHQQLYCIDPEIIISAGAVASKQILGDRNFSILEGRGIMRTTIIEGFETNYQVSVMPILHPAWLLRNPGLKKHGPIYNTYKDLETARLVLERLNTVRESTP